MTPNEIKGLNALKHIIFLPGSLHKGFVRSLFKMPLDKELSIKQRIILWRTLEMFRRNVSNEVLLIAAQELRPDPVSETEYKLILFILSSRKISTDYLAYIDYLLENSWEGFVGDWPTYKDAYLRSRRIESWTWRERIRFCIAQELYLLGESSANEKYHRIIASLFELFSKNGSQLRILIDEAKLAIEGIARTRVSRPGRNEIRRFLEKGSADIFTKNEIDI